MKFLKENRHTILRVLPVVLVALLVLFSFFFSLDLIEHDCDGDHCPVCNFICVCRAVFRVSIFCSALLLGGLSLPFIIQRYRFSLQKRIVPSPVCLGVRMNN